jgi:hypothetical protein
MTLLVLAVYCLLYKHMQENRHAAGLISHSCAPFPVGRKLAPTPATSGWADGQFCTLFCNVSSCKMLLLQLKCKLVCNIYKQTPKIVHIDSIYKQPLTTQGCTIKKNSIIGSAKFNNLCIISNKQPSSSMS